MTGRAPPGAAFEPTPIAPARRRGDSVLIASLIVVLGIGAAVAKPWDAVSDDPTTRPVASPTDAAPSAPPPDDTTAAATIDWARVAPVLEPRDDWGVRAVVYGRRSGTAVPAPAPHGTTILLERWRKTVPGPDGSRRVLLQTADQGVLLLGITYPPDELPLDVRIWARIPDGWRWLDAAPLGSSPAAGAYLFTPPRVGDRILPTWPTGSYLVEVLTGDGIRTIRVNLPDRFEVVPGPEPADVLPGPPLTSADGPSLADVPVGVAFVVQESVAIGLEASPAVDDPASRWRNGIPSVHASRGNGLGVLLPSGARDVTATLHRTAPFDDALDVQAVHGSRLAGGERSPFVIFPAPERGPWSPGIYRIEADWTLDGEPGEGAWDVELRPTTGASASRLLEATRRMAASAAPGEVVGSIGTSLRVVDLRCPDDDGVDLDEPPAVVGIGHAIGAPPASVDARLMLGAGRTVGVPVLIAREASPGLTVVVPATDRPFPAGAYRLALGGQDGQGTRTVCLGVADIE